MGTAADVFELVQPLLGDPGGDQFADADFLRPYLNSAMKVFSSAVMGNPNIPKYKRYVTIPSFPAGETSFANQHLFDKGKDLQFLDETTYIWEKVPGMSDDYYVQLDKVSYIVDLSPQAPYLFHGCYQEISDPAQPTQDILVPAASQALTIKLLGSFTGLYIADQDTPVPPQSEMSLAFLTAALAAGPYGNAGLTKGYMDAYMEQKDELVNKFVMSAQMVRNRPRAFSEDSYDYGWGLYLGQ